MKNVYKESSFAELIESNRIYQYFSEKLDVPDNMMHKPVREVCVEMNLNEDLIITLLRSYDDNYEFPLKELNAFTIPEILNYLKLTHEFYLKRKLPEIEQTIIHVFDKYKGSHQLLVLLCIFFCDYKKKLEKHIAYEERELFPYINKIACLEKGNHSGEKVMLVVNSFSAKDFVQDHTPIEDEFQQVRKTIMRYTDSQSTPLPYRVFLSQLQNFEIELCKHALVEDSVLIPRIIELEARLLKKVADQTLNRFNIS